MSSMYSSNYPSNHYQTLLTITDAVPAKVKDDIEKDLARYRQHPAFTLLMPLPHCC